MDLTGKRVLVMGLGLHGGGLGVTRWLIRQGARVAVTDLKSKEELAPTLAALGDEPVELVLGEHREADFTGADLIVRNPGVPRESRYLKLAREQGVPIRMEMGLFFEQLPRGTEQVIGITGTKGKTTTTMMVGAILKKGNAKTVVAGNLRVSALELLDQIDADTPVVLELSSFQLEEFESLPYSPHIAAITNIYPDHLNRYRDMTEYAQAKANIFKHQMRSDACILNVGDSTLMAMLENLPSRVVLFGRAEHAEDGAYLVGDEIVWQARGNRTRITGTADLAIPGAHNVENALAATAVASAWGAAPNAIAEALSNFHGVPHRLEKVREIDGITFINDTTATAPAATITALRALEGQSKRIWLIAGGSDKGLSYEEMAREIVTRSVQVLLLQGTATLKLARALDEAGAGDLVVETFSSLRQAVQKACDLAAAGDMVLLSPGAASFGMFVNEFERGDKFRAIVNSL